MIPETRSNSVFYSAKWRETCPKAYGSVTGILDGYGVPHAALSGTRDIWVRDFMPIQVSPARFERYHYMPDYLREDKQYARLISDPAEVCRANAFLDGFTYSDNTIDGQSKKKAYDLWYNNLLFHS